ncbi:MAG: cation diffusion facilitator family transporter [Candidatus Omnitrophota bacterium]|nr:cation diffusion facilitator family transporter [Candidatus Omnitrophota bacterium]MDZ4243005.1 cation diffusion facilitator family transporter [Candidatus Omnitrophota bacterium]
MTTPATTSAARTLRGLRSTLIGIIVNVALAVTKILTGVVGSSYALIADGIESSLDIFGSIVVFGGLKIGAKPPDDNHPFGHGRAEPLAAMIVSLGLLGAAGVIVIQSVREILAPHHMPAPFTLYVLVGVVLVKEILFRSVFKVGTEIDSVSVKVDAWHHRSDALTSAAAFIGISIALLGGPGFESADDWAAVFASGVIAFNGFRLLKGAVGEIMDTAVSPDMDQKIRQISLGVRDVRNIEKCRVRKSGLNYFVEVHVEVDGTMTVHRGHEIAHNVKDALLGSPLGIIDAVIHIEPVPMSQGGR